MIKNIVRNIEFLKIPSIECTIEDLYLADDLKDTLNFNIQRCVGMAANMIGVSKRAIIFIDGNEMVVMFNPVLLAKSDYYLTEEGCLSLDGVRVAHRYKKIKVEYYNEKFQKRIKTYTGYTAQIIQHELDHLEGIII
jgi:peptide deformylase